MRGRVTTPHFIAAADPADGSYAAEVELKTPVRATGPAGQHNTSGAGCIELEARLAGSGALVGAAAAVFRERETVVEASFSAAAPAAGRPTAPRRSFASLVSAGVVLLAAASVAADPWRRGGRAASADRSGRPPLPELPLPRSAGRRSCLAEFEREDRGAAHAVRESWESASQPPPIQYIIVGGDGDKGELGWLGAAAYRGPRA